MDTEDIIDWYIECKQTLYKVETFYGTYIPTVGYNTPAYFEIVENYNEAYRQLKKLNKMFKEK